MPKHPKPVLGGHDKVKVAIPQISSVYLNREASIDRAIAAMDAFDEAYDRSAQTSET